MPFAYQITQIIASVEREIQLHEQYLQLIIKEQEAITRIKPAESLECATKRSDMHDKIIAEREKRSRLLASAGGPEAPIRLSDFARTYFDLSSQRRILPMIEKLRGLIKKVQAKNQEFSQVLNFSIGMVSSTLSIIRSASQEVQKAYTGRGIIRESYHPTDRHASVLKQA
jgi:FlgN protein